MTCQLGPRFLGEQYGGEPLRHDRVGRKPLFGVSLAGDVGRYLLQVAGLLGQFPAQVARIARLAAMLGRSESVSPLSVGAGWKASAAEMRE